MKPHQLRELKKMDQKPHTVDDSVRIAQQGVSNLTQMRAAYPDAYLEELAGIGRVWVADVPVDQLMEWEFAVDADGWQGVVPFAVVATIKVYLPSSSPKARMRLPELKEKDPEFYQRVLKLLRSREAS